jgi:hypothetical protein
MADLSGRVEDAGVTELTAVPNGRARVTALTVGLVQPALPRRQSDIRHGSVTILALQSERAIRAHGIVVQTS